MQGSFFHAIILSFIKKGLYVRDKFMYNKLKIVALFNVIHRGGFYAKNKEKIVFGSQSVVFHFLMWPGISDAGESSYL